MSVANRRMRIGIAVWTLVAMVAGQMAFLPGHVGATGEVGRPPLPPGIVRLPFDGREEITNVPGCHDHDPNSALNSGNAYTTALNSRAFDFGLINEPVLAAGEGEVVRTFEDNYGAKILVLAHGNWQDGQFVYNGVRSFYIHLSEYMARPRDGNNPGDYVQPGDVIAMSGNTGMGGEYHLHFAVTQNNSPEPESIGEAANINDLPGIPWDINQLNDAGFVTNCAAPDEFADGGVVAQSEPPAEENSASSGDGQITAIAYDRSTAVDVAFGALHEDDEYDDDSANFVSKALWGGGLPRTGEWDAVLGDPHAFATFLINSYSVGDGRYVQPGTISQIMWSDNTAGGAAEGDVIAYDWEGDGTIDHVAFVTNLNSDGYPEVSEHSPSAENRYWSYSDEDDNWIEHARPGSVAYLIRIEPVTSGGF